MLLSLLFHNVFSWELHTWRLTYISPWDLARTWELTLNIWQCQHWSNNCLWVILWVENRYIIDTLPGCCRWMKVYSSYIRAESLLLLPEDDFYLKTGKMSTELSLSSDKVNTLKGFRCKWVSEALMQRTEENGYGVFSCLFISFVLNLWQLSGNLPLGNAHLTTFQMFHQNMSNSSNFPTGSRKVS